MTGVFCNQCGHQNPAGSNFCSSCGAVLEHKGDDETTTTTITFQAVESAGEVDGDEISVTLDEVAAGFGVLVVKRGPNAGSRFVLDAELTRVGRHPDSDIFFDDITVSRRHAEFARAVTATWSATWDRSTAPISTASASTRAQWKTATRSRSESSGLCS